MNGKGHCLTCGKPIGCFVGECEDCSTKQLGEMRSTFAAREMRFGGRWDCEYCGFSCPAEMGGTQYHHLESVHGIKPEPPAPRATPEQLVEKYREALKALLELGWIAGEPWQDYLKRHDRIINDALALGEVNEDNSRRTL